MNLFAGARKRRCRICIDFYSLRAGMQFRAEKRKAARPV